MLDLILNIMYIIVILLILFDAFSNFLETFMDLYINSRKNNLKEINYLKHLLTSRFVFFWKTLLQPRVFYPILVFISPIMLDKWMDQKNINQIYGIIFKYSILILFTFVLLIYLKMNAKKPRIR